MRSAWSERFAVHHVSHVEHESSFQTSKWRIGQRPLISLWLALVTVLIWFPIGTVNLSPGSLAN